jgi:hypothetical protein
MHSTNHHPRNYDLESRHAAPVAPRAYKSKKKIAEEIPHPMHPGEINKNKKYKETCQQETTSIS